MLDQQSVAEAANAALQMFNFRQSPIQLECRDWEDPYEKMFGAKQKVSHLLNEPTSSHLTDQQTASCRKQIEISSCR